MAEAEGIPPSASVASTGFGLRYVGNWAYAYSGVQDTPNSEFTLLETISGSGLIVGTLYFAIGNASAGGSDDMRFKVFMNDEVIYETEVGNSSATYLAQNTIYVELIIPPFTKFKCTSHDLTAAAANNTSAVFTGRVYDA